MRSVSKESYSNVDTDETEKKEEEKDLESGVEYVPKVEMP